MNFKLVESGWDEVIANAVKKVRAGAQLRIICPFIKEVAARRFLHGSYKNIQVITRFDLNCFRAGVSDTSTLRTLLKTGAQIHGVRNLHAKVFLIGKRAIVTSANITEQALKRNHEFGFWSDDPAVVASCNSYFDGLWRRSGDDLEISTIDNWDAQLSKAIASTIDMPSGSHLSDYGVDLGHPSDAASEVHPANMAEQGFVKFTGTGNNRGSAAAQVREQVDSSGSHWALCYPSSRVPRSVRNGAVMFISRLVEGNDILVYGRAIGRQYRAGRDDATLGDLKQRPWKKHWSRYIHVDQPEFIDGTLADGVSLNRLKKEIGPFAFATTKARHLRGERNINLSASYARRAQVELTPEAIVWLNDKLDQCLHDHGRIPPDVLDDFLQPEP